MFAAPPATQKLDTAAPREAAWRTSRQIGQRPEQRPAFD